MPVAAAIGAAGALGSAAFGYFGSKQASAAQAQQQQNALNQQNALFQQGLGLNQPFINAGQSAASTLQNLLTGKNPADIESMVPGLASVLKLGQMGATNQATTTGLGQNAAFAVGNTVNQLGLNQGFVPLVNALQGLTNTGAQSAQSAFGNATQTGSNLANTYGNLGNAQASGILGGANALSAGFGGVANAAALPFALNYLRGQGQGQNQNSGVYGDNNSSFSPPSS